jgi:hypothetical protein
VTPDGFVLNASGELVGLLTKDEIEISWTSQAYDSLWTVRPYLEISQAGA